MKKLTDSKVFWMIVSLTISIVLWVYVTSMESDEVKQTLKGVRVELLGESTLRDSRNLVVTGLSSNTVSVEITGPRRVIASMNADKVTAQIDVSKLAQSAYTSLPYTVNYPNGTDTANITVTRKVPDTISFTVSKLNSKSVPVRGVFNGTIAEGYTAEPANYEPSEITVSGPDAYLRNISYAWVNFGSAETNTTYTVETGFTLRNEADEDVETEGVTCSTDVVTATLPILQKKTLPLTVNLIYGAGADEGNTKLSIEPSEITLAGDSAILSSMNNIPIATIDLSDFASTFNSKYPINFDNSLVNISGLTEAEVKVELIGLETRNFTVRNLQCRNVPEGFEANIVSEAIVVRMRGTPEELETLNADDILAYADFSDYDITTGSHLIPVKIQVDGSNECGAVNGSYSISVEIGKQEKEIAQRDLTKAVRQLTEKEENE